jgi:sulfate permease, SulP family
LDQSAIAALDKVIFNFRRQDVEVDVVGFNEASASLVKKLAIHDKPDDLKELDSH